MEYYHGNISKADAEKLLTDFDKDGGFLVRDSEGITGAYVLCLWANGKVYYYRVLSNAEGMYYIQSEHNVTPLSGHTLDQLITECMRHETRNGLATALRYPIKKSITAPTPVSPNRLAGGSISFGANESSGFMNTSITSTASFAANSSSLAEHEYVNDEDPADETVAYYMRRFRRLDLSAFDSVFACRLKTYVEKELQHDVGSASGRADSSKLTPASSSNETNAESSRLSYLNRLMVDSADGFIRQLATYRAQLDAIRELFCETIAESSGASTLKPSISSVEELLDSCASLKAETANLHSDARKSIQAFVTKRETVYDEFSTQILPSAANYYEARAQSQVVKPALKPKPSVKLSSTREHSLSVTSAGNASNSNLSLDGSSANAAAASASKAAPLSIPQRVFQVRGVPKRGQTSQFLLTVDIEAGTLHIHQVRASRDALELRGSFTHAQVEQLIKSSKDDASRLELRASQNGRDVRETVVFTDTKQRELFCQLIEQVKCRHQSRSRLERISVFVGTWNMANEPCDWNISSWLRSQGDGSTRSKTLSLLAHDVYVIGVQECSLSKDELVKRLRQAFRGFLNEELELIEVVTMWALRLVVLTRYEHRHRISDVQHYSVPTGLAKKIGNKGAVAVSFNFNRTSFLFVNAHLPSGDERLGKRNSDFKHIFKHLNSKRKSMSGIDITHQYQYVFWFGDLNYRIQEQLSFILDKCSQHKINELTERDQLRLCQRAKEAFSIFSEAPVDFLPTYRYRKQSRDQFACEKYLLNGAYRINAPAYTDRVLYHAAYAELHQLVHCTSYGMSPNVCTSDHKPVFSSFEVYLVNEPLSIDSIPNVPAGGKNARDVIFELGSVESTFATLSPHRSYIVEVHSSVLVGCTQSKPTTQFANNAVISEPVQSGQVVAPVWTSSSFPTLEPSTNQLEQLREACFIFAVKNGTSSTDECIGSALLPLRNFFDAYDRSPETVQKSYFFFKLTLVNCGDQVGCFRGALRFADESRIVQRLRSASNVSQSKRSEGPSVEPTYQPIYIDTDEITGMHKQPFVVEEISNDELAVPTDALVDLADNSSFSRTQPSIGSAFNPIGRFCDVNYADTSRLGGFAAATDSD